MMARLCTMLLFLPVAAVSNAQAMPDETDSAPYAEAYDLIFDSQARARKAEQLLLDQGARSLEDLSAKELSLLCRIYNELFDFEKQMATAKLLWAKDPDTLDATLWMENSYFNLLRNSASPEGVIAFVEKAFSEEKGNRRVLLILKARAVLVQREGMGDAERRVLVADLLIEASAEPLPEAGPNQLASISPELIIDNDTMFARFFSAPEREAIKLRMKKAKAVEDGP